MVKYMLLVPFCLIVACQQKKESDTEKNYLIAYNVLVDGDNGNYDIFIVNPENGDTKNISNHPDVAWTYTNVGSNLFYISDKNECARCFYLYKRDLQGVKDRKITNFRLRDSWMGFRKEGEEIIVNPHESVDSVFYIIDLKKNILKKVNTGLAYASDPTFSPNGKKIAFRGALKKIETRGWVYG